MKFLKILGAFFVAVMLFLCIALGFMRYEETQRADRAALEAAHATPDPSPTPALTPEPLRHSHAHPGTHSHAGAHPHHPPDRH